MKPESAVQPRYFDSFHCIGSQCEDTCCVGSIVHVDEQTYHKYQSCSDPELGTQLRSLITIREDRTGPEDFARIVSKDGVCSFLSEGLCSVHLKLGESYLPNVCATYPRVLNHAGEVVQRSLDLSCPEAARLALLDPAPMEFTELPFEDGSVRAANYPALDVSGLLDSPEPYRFYRDVRRLVLALLQNRSYPIWKRLLLLGIFCEKLNAMPAADRDRTGLSSLAKEMDQFDRAALFNSAEAQPADPAVQLEAVLELIVARISADYNPRSFLDCYRQFIDGLEWTASSTMEDIGSRYSAAHAESYAPYMHRHEYILEHYLVNYAHRTLFPFGLPESNRRLARPLGQPNIAAPIAQYMLLIAYFAITQTLLIGIAGFHKGSFGTEHVVKIIQSCSKTFEHSLAYPGQVIGMLAGKGMTSPLSLCALWTQEEPRRSGTVGRAAV